MARTNVFIRDGSTVQVWRTDLHGHGPVRVGEEFTAYQLTQYGSPRLVPGGKRRRVRVTAIFRPEGGSKQLIVEDLDDQP